MSGSGEAGAGATVLAQVTSALLDPVLGAGPFRRGDGTPAGLTLAGAGETPSPWPEPEQSVQVLWCAPASDVARDLPGLWAQVRRQVPSEGGCVDVTIDLDVLARLVAADVEGVPLADLLSGVGDVVGSAAAAELPGLVAEVAVPALADLFERLLAASR